MISFVASFIYLRTDLHNMQMEYNAHEPAEFLDYFMQSHSIYFY